MKKDLRPIHDVVSCDVCGRTILKGERTEVYLAPGGHRNVVCELCFVRAEHGGWIRESAADQVPAHAHRAGDRRVLFGRRRRKSEDSWFGRRSVDADGAPANGDALAEDPGDRFDDGFESVGRAVEAPPPDELRPRRAPPQDPRPVRAVPTTAEVKVQRAIELFNVSEHRRTVAGLARSLGYPWVMAAPDPAAPSAVTLVAAWELSWYTYRIDLGEAAEPVVLIAKGDELEDLDEPLRQWNAALDQDGMVAMEAVES